MTLKRIVTAALLLFIAVAVITAVMKSSPESGLPATSVSHDESRDPSAAPADGLTAIFFHGETRCPTCRKIEDYAHQALQEAFPDQIRKGDIEWRTANYDDPAKKQLAVNYKVYSSTVVLVRVAEGTTTDWRNLEQVWEFVDDEDAFKQYVQAEAREIFSL